MIRGSSLGGSIQALVEDFAAKLAALVETMASDRAREAVMRAFGPGDRRRLPVRVTRDRRMPVVAPVPNQSRVRQGRYMGGLRGLSKDAQARVKQVRKKEGMDAALRMIDKLG